MTNTEKLPELEWRRELEPGWIPVHWERNGTAYWLGEGRIEIRVKPKFVPGYYRSIIDSDPTPGSPGKVCWFNVLPDHSGTWERVEVTPVYE